MIIKRESVSAMSVDGLEIRDYTAGLDTSSSLAIVVVPPGGRHKTAWSTRSDKYYYVIDGVVAFAVDGSEHFLGAGDCCLIARSERFHYENRRDTLATLLLVHTPSFRLEHEVFA
jgi:mannose-6-phosphate isomerase-like protein (cupin superfamily)